MSDFVAISGQTVTDEMLDRLEAVYAAGEFPPGSHPVGDVIHGAPRALSAEGSATLSVKIPVAMKRAIADKAKREHVSTSEVVRAMLARSLVGA